MSITLYKNSRDILRTNGVVRGRRITDNDLDLLEGVEYQMPFGGDGGANTSNPYQVELHIYTEGGGLVASDHELESWRRIDRASEKVSGRLLLDVHNDLRSLNIFNGSYKIVYNFFKNHVGSFSSVEKLFVSEISPSRRELKLKLTHPESNNSKQLLINFITKALSVSPAANDYVLNFGDNLVVKVIAVGNSNEEGVVYIKLYDALPKSIGVNTSCWISSEIMHPYTDSVMLIPTALEKPYNTLRGPNTSIDYDYWITTETDFKNWNDILGSDSYSTQQILDKYFSSSLEGVTLNIDYSDFENFVHFSSATERFKNFVYKLQLLEYYDTQLNILNSTDGDTGTNHITLQNNRNKVVDGFDGFERWMYYDFSGSYKYTYPGSSSLYNYPKVELFGSATGSADYIRNGSYYKLLSTTSSQAVSWYNDHITLAEDYDAQNINALRYSIPEFMLEDSSNTQYVVFVDMIGQHFDIMYSYINGLTKMSDREEHPNDGIPDDMLYVVAKNMGWTLTHGNQKNDLWKYALNLDDSGKPFYTGNSIAFDSISDEKKTKEIWRRIVNNLPYILKTKGTERSVKALLACYGVPSTIMSIREYGGGSSPFGNTTPTMTTDKFTYFLNITGSYKGYARVDNAQYISSPWLQLQPNTTYPTGFELRFRPEDNNLYNYSLNRKQTLAQLSNGANPMHVVLDVHGTDIESASISAYIHHAGTYHTMSVQSPYMLDGNPLTLLMQRGQASDAPATQSYSLYVGKAKYGKIHFIHSSSIVLSGSHTGWQNNGSLVLGSGSNAQTTNSFSGSFFELRYWNNVLDIDAFSNHILGPRAYNGNTPTSSYYDLSYQVKFWDKFDASATQSIVSTHPNQNYDTFSNGTPTSASLVGFTSNSFEGIVEQYTMEVPTVGGAYHNSQKIRIEDDTTLIGNLSPHKRVEYSSYDKNALDSDKLMIAFSPQHIINEDIAEHTGYVSIDDYIGDPEDVFSDSYNELKWFSRQYWKKYPNKNDFSAYLRLISIFDFSMFHQIRQLLPLRSNALLGLVIEPNILERSKVKTAVKPTATSPQENNKELKMLSGSAVTPLATYNKIQGSTRNRPTLDGEYGLYEGEIDNATTVQTEFSSEKEGSIDNILRVPTTYNTYRTQLPASIVFRMVGEYASYNTLIDELNFYVGSDSLTQNLYRTSSAYNEGFGFGWVQRLNPYWKRDGVTPYVSKSRSDGFLSEKYYIYASETDRIAGTVSSASYRDYEGMSPYVQPLGVQRARYYGSKLVGQAINVNSDETTDGSPVVEVQTGRGTQLVYSQYNISGSFTTQ